MGAVNYDTLTIVNTASGNLKVDKRADRSNLLGHFKNYYCNDIVVIFNPN